MKYARVHRDKESDIWSNNNNNRFNAIAPLPGASAARSSWDLGKELIFIFYFLIHILTSALRMYVCPSIMKS